MFFQLGMTIASDLADIIELNRPAMNIIPLPSSSYEI